MIARLRCWFFGHPRGKRIDLHTVKCSRCGAEWAREKKAKT